MKSHVWGPHQSSIYLVRINPTNSINLELRKLHSCLCKVKRKKRLFENQSGIKTVRVKNWIFEVYLKIGVSKIIGKLKSWELNLKIGILEIENLKNCLKVEF